VTALAATAAGVSGLGAALFAVGTASRVLSAGFGAAAKKAAEIEKRLVRETRSELENEVSDIRELRDEYKALVSTILSYEKSTRDKDAEKIADLEGRLAEADATAERRIRVAEEKARRKFDREVADLRESFDATAEDVARRRDEGATDRRVEDAFKSDAEMRRRTGAVFRTRSEGSRADRLRSSARAATAAKWPQGAARG